MNLTKNQRLILASSSHRRRELLSLAGVMFDVIPANVAEDHSIDQNPDTLAQKIANEKAIVLWHHYPDRYILAADTIVAIPSAALETSLTRSSVVQNLSFPTTTRFAILGKPRDELDAQEMLLKLQGHTHWVYTAFTLCCHAKNYQVNRVVKTQVAMRPLTQREITAYLATGEYADKAGAYAIQGRAIAFISDIQGSLTNVIGLPLAEVLSELKLCGLCL